MENCCAWVLLHFFILFNGCFVKKQKVLVYEWFRVEIFYFLNIIDEHPAIHFFSNETNEPFSSVWLCENAWEFDTRKCFSRFTGTDWTIFYTQNVFLLLYRNLMFCLQEETSASGRRKAKKSVWSASRSPTTRLVSCCVRIFHPFNWHKHNCLFMILQFNRIKLKLYVVARAFL